MKRPEIGNLEALVYNRNLNLHQKVDAYKDFEKLMKYIEELEQLQLGGVVGQSKQLKAFADYLNSRLGEPMYSTQAHVDEYLKSL